MTRDTLAGAVEDSQGAVLQNGPIHPHTHELARFFFFKLLSLGLFHFIVKTYSLTVCSLEVRYIYSRSGPFEFYFMKRVTPSQEQTP